MVSNVGALVTTEDILKEKTTREKERKRVPSYINIIF